MTLLPPPFPSSDISPRFPRQSWPALARRRWRPAGIGSFCARGARDNSTIAIASINIIDIGSSLENHTFYLFSKGFTNLLGLNPFSRPAPKPLILAVPSEPTVSVLPVRTLAFAILNYKQLSRLRSSLSFGPSTGDYPSGDILSAFYSASYSLRPSSSASAYSSSLK